jgi:hypothetical protein
MIRKKISRRFCTFKKKAYLCKTKAEMLTFFEILKILSEIYTWFAQLRK